MRYVVLCLCLIWGAVVQAGEILAIVNDAPISDFDVELRAKMIGLQQQKDPADLKKVALEDLIDEQMKYQEIAKRKITVADEEVYNAIAQMEQQNGLPIDGLKQILKEQGIPYMSLLKQVQINLGWMKLLQSSSRAVMIQPKEIETRKELIRRNLQKTLLSFYEVVVKTPKEAQEVLNKIKSGARIEEVLDYSVAPSKHQGGRVIGVDENYYGEKVAPVLKSLAAGDVSKPIPVKGGYAIVIMMNKRAPITHDDIDVWELAQAVLSENSTVALGLDRVKECDAFMEATKDEALPGSHDRGMINPDQLPEDIFALLKDAPVKTVVGPEKVPVGNLYFMKCRVEKQRIVPSDEELRMRIGMEKMELLSRQILSELKRDVVIEYK